MLLFRGLRIMREVRQHYVARRLAREDLVNQTLVETDPEMDVRVAPAAAGVANETALGEFRKSETLDRWKLHTAIHGLEFSDAGSGDCARVHYIRAIRGHGLY